MVFLEIVWAANRWTADESGRSGHGSLLTNLKQEKTGFSRRGEKAVLELPRTAFGW